MRAAPTEPKANPVARAPGSAEPRATRPRLGFLGLGWIGRHRMQAIAAAGIADIVALADPSPDALASAAESAPDAAHCADLDDLLTRDLDALVIATPSALHAPQAIAALDRGLAVFCQKPLARTAEETRAVIDAARRANRLLAVDFSYRFTRAFQAILDRVRAGELGDLFAIDLTFHNAYGPDKPWFRDPALSGGGCVIDLGVHLIDLALVTLDCGGAGFQPAQVTHVSSTLFSGGRRVGRLSEPTSARSADLPEDFAFATLETSSGAAIRLTCSWNLHAGRDAVIEASFYGTRGGAQLRNVNGSFYDFTAERFAGTKRWTIAEPPDPWGGRAAAEFAERLARGDRFDPACERLIAVAEAIDRIYGR